MAESTDRTGLYILVFIILLSTCESAYKIDRIDARVREMHSMIVGEQGGSDNGD